MKGRGCDQWNRQNLIGINSTRLTHTKRIISDLWDSPFTDPTDKT